MKKTTLLFTSILLSITLIYGQTGIPDKDKVVWVEAESFEHYGGWVVDSQFIDEMGSSYLMAHGLGKPVIPAYKRVPFPKEGAYNVYVRTYNWVSPWHKKDGPGAFYISVNGEPVAGKAGMSGDKWEWQKIGTVIAGKGDIIIGLHDLTGFNGRCDALLFSADTTFVPSSLYADVEQMRAAYSNKAKPKKSKYDLVVTGGGVAGISTAVSAARLGLKVALVQDRPLLGGNNSSEVRVHLGGRIGLDPYPELGALVAEMGPLKGGNAQPGDYYEDDKKLNIVKAEKNISLFLNNRVVSVEMKDSLIKSVCAVDVITGNKIELSAPLFADCTGDGVLGYLAGADYTMGREGRSVYNEPTAPENTDLMTMGSSVQWYSVKGDSAAEFPEFSFGLDVSESSVEKVHMGEWTWETGMTWNQIEEFEKTRDYGLLVVFSNWSFLKNKSQAADKFANNNLEWVAYVAGKRESRRLMGDYILKEQDITSGEWQEDGTASTSWSIDLHYPDPANAKHYPEQPFKSIAVHQNIHPYPIPYRCFYSRNINNLFMAGRNISVSHVALGTVRVMRTTGMMGEVVGMAASVCRKNKSLPRSVYTSHFQQLKDLMIKGVGSMESAAQQQYNEGSTLGPRE